MFTFLLDTEAGGAATTAATQPGGLMSMLPMLLMIGGLILVMYFFMIRPQKKQERELNDMRNNLRVGDEITTIGGIVGEVVAIKGDNGEVVDIETSRNGTKLRILKTAIRSVDVKAEDEE